MMYEELPNNISAEQALLGSLLVNNEGLENIVEFLQEEHFYHPLHGDIYREIKNLISIRDIANPITLKPFVERSEGLKKLGGVKYLLELATNSDSITNIKHYANSVYNMYLSRNLFLICEEGTRFAKGETEIKKQIEALEQKLFSLADCRDTKGGFKNIESPLMSTILQVESIMKGTGKVGLRTGFDGLDKKIGGLKKTDLTIIAARPSMGKTALATCIAYNTAKIIYAEEIQKAEKEGRPVNPKNMGAVGVFSLEMSEEQLANRLLAMESGINSFDILNGKVDNQQFSKLVDTKDYIANLPIFIDDTPALTISTLRTRARRLKRQQNLSLLVVDYLQLLHGSENTKSNRVNEISEITQGLKAIAKELDIPVIALSQLSRAVEQREDKRPILSDLRESGSIEQDADIVMFLYREEYYLSRSEPDTSDKNFDAWRVAMERTKNTADVFVAKNRHGSIGNIKMYFDKNTTKFSDYYEIDNAMVIYD